MYTPLPHVLDLKTTLDAFHFLCLVEGNLMSIRACQRLGLGLEREAPTELNDVENAVIYAGEAFGGFLLVMQYGYISTLSAGGQALLTSLDTLSKDIHASYWAQAVEQGKRDVEADIAIGELEAGW
ncbi:hypothetical protein I5M92_22235 [Serratia marcescens]|uniref:hypothetical protein n=1 Tax=Serratia marcescens TaxID=615 RepID=UPI000A3B1054|nr:hypothetical protein [Serratia marcescens]MBH3072798.1 hypothetical protein [Serratia marcescens]OUI68943.1 hypothetical protein AZZ99_003234 [Serratia marcescens]HEJ0329792.1 hypothetical protein [Serratia marcescens]